jgi:hypothetical protein
MCGAAKSTTRASSVKTATAKPDEILLTGAAKAVLGDKSDFSFEDIGAGSFGGDPNYRVSYKRRVSYK